MKAAVKLLCGLAFCLCALSQDATPSLPLSFQPPLRAPNFVVPGSDPMGVWGRIQDKVCACLDVAPNLGACPIPLRTFLRGLAPHKIALA